MFAKQKIAVVLILVLCTTIIVPVPVFAAAAADEGGIVGGLLGWLVNLFNQLFHIQPGGSTMAPPSEQRVSGQKDVIGFYAEWYGTDTSSFNDLRQHTDAIGTIAPFWATLNPDGSVADRGGNDHNAVVAYAKKNKITTLLLVNNAKQSDDTKGIHLVLASPSLRRTAIDNLEAYLKKYNLDGINIDFESVPAGDRDNLTAFMQELSARLKPQGYIVTIDVFAKHNEETDISMAYDYAALARVADRIILMTYDYHGSWSGPGAVADIPSVERDLKYALTLIPKNKLYLGVAGYGYDWSSKGVESLEFGAIQNLVSRFGSKVEWDDSAKAPHFSYTGPDGVTHQVWFENKQSLQYKLNLVNKYDIAGIALWKLGEEDPGSWPLIKSSLRI